MSTETTQRSVMPYSQLRAAAALVYQVPMLGVELECGSRVRAVGTVVHGSDRVHPSVFRDLVGAAIEARSLEPLYSGLDLPIGQAIDVRLVRRSADCVGIAGGVIRVSSLVGPMYLFATDMWWPSTISVLLDETETAAMVSSRFGQIDQYLDIVQSVEVDSAFDDLLEISLITVRHQPRDRNLVSGIEQDHVAAVTESIAQGLAERFSSLTVLR